MTWKTYIAQMRHDWIGTNVIYEGKPYTVIDVDYNGALLINRPTYFDDGTMIKKDTAISEYDIEK